MVKSAAGARHGVKVGNGGEATEEDQELRAIDEEDWRWDGIAGRDCEDRGEKRGRHGRHEGLSRRTIIRR